MKGAATKVNSSAKEEEDHLGHAWSQADDLDAHKSEYNEGTGLFFIFTVVALSVVAISTFLILYLITPRLAQFHQFLPAVLTYITLFLVISAFTLLFLTYLTVRTGKNIFPNFLGRRGKEKGLIMTITPAAVKLGGLIGISQDRMGSSFIKVNNAIVGASCCGAGAKSILLLLPRCIQHSKCKQKVEIDINNCKECGLCDIADIIHICEDNSVDAFVATGGNLARKLIKERRPAGVIGVACERELLSGIQDTAGLPVYGIPNLRPEGPCKDTRVELAKVDAAIKAFIK